MGRIRASCLHIQEWVSEAHYRGSVKLLLRWEEDFDDKSQAQLQNATKNAIAKIGLINPSSPAMDISMRNPKNTFIESTNIEDELIDIVSKHDTTFDTKSIKKLIGGQGLNRLQRVLAGLIRYTKGGGKPDKDLIALGVLAAEDKTYLSEFLKNIPKKIPFMERDSRRVANK